MIADEARYGSPYDRLCEFLHALISRDPDLAGAIRRRCSGLSDGEATLTAARSVASAHAAYRAERASLATSGDRVCRVCGRRRPIASFARNGRGGVRSECNECRSSRRQDRAGGG